MTKTAQPALDRLLGCPLAFSTLRGTDTRAAGVLARGVRQGEDELFDWGARRMQGLGWLKRPLAFDESERFWKVVHRKNREGFQELYRRLLPVTLDPQFNYDIAISWPQWPMPQRRAAISSFLTLDDAWKICDFPRPLRRQLTDYHVLDFSPWQNEAFFAQQFGKLQVIHKTERKIVDNPNLAPVPRR